MQKGSTSRLCAVAFVAATVAANADETPAPEGIAEFVPAQFEEGTESAASQIEYPSHKGDIAFFINCGVSLAATGEVNDLFCLDYYGSQDARFQRAARKYLRKAKFAPAQVNGVAVPVTHCRGGRARGVLVVFSKRTDASIT